MAENKGQSSIKWLIMYVIALIATVSGLAVRLIFFSKV